MVIGRNTPTIAKPMASNTSVITVKVRSVKTANGSSGSASWVRNWRQRNSPSKIAPAPITIGMVRKPAMVPQSYRSPSIRPKTTPSRPAVSRATPGMSSRCRSPGRTSGM